MKNLSIALLIMVSASAFAQPIVENHELQSPTWQQNDKDQGNKKIYGVLMAKGGSEPIEFKITNTQNATVTLDDNDGNFTAVIIDCNKPANFQYIAIDANNQKSTPATITLKCGFTSDEMEAGVPSIKKERMQ